MASPDWEAIESAYRAGSLSIRAIAEKHGVSHVGITKRTAKEDWQRDLTDKVRNATKAKLTKAVTSNGNQSDMVTDAQIVEQASDEAATVVLAHHEGLAAWRGITNKLRTIALNRRSMSRNVRICALPIVTRKPRSPTSYAKRARQI